MKSLIPAALGAPAFVALLATGCVESMEGEERRLAELGELSAVVDVDVGVPQDPYGFPNYATGLSVFIDYPSSTCYSLDDSASAKIDDVDPDTFMTGGFETSSKDSSAYC